MVRNILFFLFVLFAFQFSAQTKKQTITIKTPNTCNHCKICETCGGLLETDLYYVKGIKSVTYNEDEMTTTIVYLAKKTSPEKIRQAISKLGFPADDLPADPEAYAKRDACCK